MKTAIAALASASVLIALAAPGMAASKRPAYRYNYAAPYTSPSILTPELKRHNEEAYERGDYYEHDSNALPIGSRAWFDQKRREAGG